MIADAAGVEIPADSQIIAVRVEAVGKEELFCKENGSGLSIKEL